jgi:hypothetical protein
MQAQGVLAGVDAGKFEAVTSELTLAECLIKPLQLGQHETSGDLIKRFHHDPISPWSQSGAIR